MFSFLQDPLYLLVILPGILIGLTVHEFAHGLVAYRLGDSTAKDHGRLTLNPLAHIDILGFIMLVIARFGWAKPVPVNPYNFRGSRTRGMVYVAVAGPAANLAAAAFTAVIWGLFLSRVAVLQDFLAAIIYMNVVLAVFNLIPVPPLDGSKILAGLAPSAGRYIYAYEQYGPLVLILLLFTGVFSRILGPVIYKVFQFFITVANFAGSMPVRIFG